MLFDNLVGKEKVIRPPGSRRIAGKFRVTQDYGCTGVTAEPRLDNCAHFHRGLDISDALCGAAVFAPRAGKIKFAGKLGNGEIVVVINHRGGWGTSYGHLASRDVDDGDRVAQGQKIGAIGDTGNAFGCHLHFAVKSDLPAGWGRLDFIPNPLGGTGETRGRGKWQNPWPLLVQNVTVHPRIDVFDIRIRTAPDLGDTLFATTEPDGTIHRAADGVSLGATAAPRRYGGSVTGAAYTIDGIVGTTWERIELDGDFRFIATPLAVVSAT
jgi:murein DD-endopeptidase MepM/ murein hydrolase activator NlpD